MVLHGTLHGDVIGEASIEFMRGSEVAESVAWLLSGPQAGPAKRAAVLCDAVGQLLAVAGWETVTLKIRRIRDGLSTGKRPNRWRSD